MTSKRQLFSEPQVAQYFELSTLSKMAGRPPSDFHRVIVKELVDNSLDAAEAVGIDPEIRVQIVGGRSFFAGHVFDNGLGITSETLDKLLDYSTFTSDKALYRTPTRGQQGNATKALFAMPFATGYDRRDPVVESLGFRHTIHARLDDAGLPSVGRESTADGSGDGRGTQVQIPIRVGYVNQRGGGQLGEIRDLVRAYALFNPHAKVSFAHYKPPTQQGESAELVETESHLPTNLDYRKFTGADPLVIHWFDEGSFLKLIRAYLRADDDLPTGQFIKLFRGFSSRAKAKAAREAVADARHLSDLTNGDASALLEVMQEVAQVPNHKALGEPLGLDHLVGSLKEMYPSEGRHRHWYSRAIRTILNGAPAIVEAVALELEERSALSAPLYLGLNHSPLYEDPMSDIRITSPAKDIDTRGWGIKGYLQDARALDYAHPFAIAVHIIAAAPFTVDFAKTKLSLDSREFVEAVGTALGRITKQITKEARARERDAAKTAREAERQNRDEKPSVTREQACYEVMHEAYMFSTGNEALPTLTRDLYYAVRNRIERFGYDADELTYEYFCRILPKYRREVQELPKVEYEPRGRLYEPHGGQEVPIGTRAVAEYSFPDYVYKRILYIEKAGRVQILRAAGLDKKYDMALVAGQGFATEAIRNLFESAEKGAYELYVLHDADRSGYGIARTLREETERMPGYSVDVIDIGLKLEEALAMGKRPETHTAKNRLDAKVEAQLTEIEREHFVGEEQTYYDKNNKRKTQWICKRVELNDLSSPQLVEYVEKKLAEHGATEKVIPTEEDMPERAKRIYDSKVDTWVDEIITELIGTDELKRTLREEFEGNFKLQGARTWAATEFARRDIKKSWRQAVRATLEAAYSGKHQEAMQERVVEHLNKVGKAHADHQ
jgi:DNA topoisomerase VI subunit B